MLIHVNQKKCEKTNYLKIKLNIKNVHTKIKHLIKTKTNRSLTENPSMY